MENLLPIKSMASQLKFIAHISVFLKLTRFGRYFTK